MGSVLYNLPAGTAKPTAFVQFSTTRALLYIEDARPISIQANQIDGRLEACAAGIKPPLTAPNVANHASTSATNLASGTVLQIAYRYYSTRRQTPSQLSPVADLTTDGHVVTVSGFVGPRDPASIGGIDRIQVCVRAGTNTGLMCVLPTMEIDCSNYDFAGKSLTFDLSQTQLEAGFNASIANLYAFVPPAVKFAEAHGQRIWMGGQRDSVQLAATGISVTKAQAFRGGTYAKLTLTGDGVWDDSHLYMSVHINGRNIGNIFDIVTGTVAYLDTDVAENIADTQNFFLGGANDRIWPTAWHGWTQGNAVTPFPECASLYDYQLLEPGVDRGDHIMGLKRAKGLLWIVMREAVMVMSGQDQPGTPLPVFETFYGRIGTMAPGSVCLMATGEVAWLGEEGISIADTGGVNSIAHELGIDRFFKSEWVDPTCKADIVMTWSRQFEGFIIGGLSIYDATAAGYVTGWWGLLQLKPQYGLFLFDGQAITSNILEYADSNGDGVLLAGDASGGRVKRLLDPAVLTDVQADETAAAAAFTCLWRSGWKARPDGGYSSLGTLRIPGMILPGSTLALTVAPWGADFPVRHEADVLTVNKQSLSVTQDDLPGDIHFPPNQARYHSIGFQWSSTSGADGTRPMELTRAILLDTGES